MGWLFIKNSDEFDPETEGWYSGKSGKMTTVKDYQSFPNFELYNPIKENGKIYIGSIQAIYKKL